MNGTLKGKRRRTLSYCLSLNGCPGLEKLIYVRSVVEKAIRAIYRPCPGPCVRIVWPARRGPVRPCALGVAGRLRRQGRRRTGGPAACLAPHVFGESFTVRTAGTGYTVVTGGQQRSRSRPTRPIPGLTCCNRAILVKGRPTAPSCWRSIQIGRACRVSCGYVFSPRPRST